MKKELGTILRELRGKMSLREAAKLSGVSHAYLDRLEKGMDPRTGKEIEPSPSTLKSLARAYKVSYPWLLTLAGYWNPSLPERRRALDFALFNNDEAIRMFEDHVIKYQESGIQDDVEFRSMMEKIYTMLFDDEGELKIDRTSRVIASDELQLPNNAQQLNDLVRVPVLGSIRAGIPMEMIRESAPEYELVENNLIGSHDSFVLEVKGDSMIGDYIFDGDRVVVLYTPDYSPSDICVVAIDGEEATLKRVKCQGDICMLTPSNPEIEPMMYPARDVYVIGVVVEVRRRIKR